MNFRKAAISAFIVWHLGNLFIEGMPSAGGMHDAFRDAQSWYLNSIGQWQGSIAFYGPEPMKESVRIKALLRYSDGSSVRWESPQWSQLSLWEKFLSCRLMKYYDSLRKDDFSGDWDPFAVGLARSLEPGKRLATAELTRVWSEVPPPESARFNRFVIPEEDHRFTFLRRDYK